MSERILFRFHKNFEVCRQNIRLLRLQNPGIPIDGMFGGEGSLGDFPADFTALFDTLWAFPLDDPHYKWKNGDLCTRWWFKETGHRHDFTHLYLIEWDLLFLKPLAEVFGTLEQDCNYASIFGDCAEAKKKEWYWIREQFGHETGRMLHHLKETGRPVDFENLNFGIMGGCVFSRKFLEMFSAEWVSSHSNDECRLSIYSAAYGIPLLDNRLMADTRNRFNADNNEYSEQDLDAVLAAGGAVIHPLRIVIDGIDSKIVKA